MAPIPALAPFCGPLQSDRVSVANLVPVIGELRRQLSQPGGLGLNPAESQEVHNALQGFDQAVSRYSDAFGEVKSSKIEFAFSSLVRAWPARLYVPDDVTGRYDITGEFGIGGFSKIYHGNHMDDGTLVAIKVVEIPEGKRDTPEGEAERVVFEDALKREYQILKMLPEGAGPKVFELGTIEGHLCLVMELLEGEDLFDLHQDFVRRFQDVEDLRRFLKISEQTVEAVARLHGAQIVHCDVKPENFKFVDSFKSRHRLVRVIDFGLASRVGQYHTMVMGTPYYMPPESWNEANAVSFGRDVFALGGVLYGLMTGKVPFRGSSFIEIARNIMTTIPEPPSVVLLNNRPELAQALPGGLLNGFDEIVRKALQKERRNRYPDATEMLSDLRSLNSSNWEEIQAIKRKAG